MPGRKSATVGALKLGALGTLLSLGGCFTYSASSLESVAPGTQTRIRLDADGFGRVANQAAMNGIAVEAMDLNRRGIVGRLMDVGSGNLSLQIRGTGGSVFTADVPTVAVQEIAVRSFSKKNTALVIAGGIVLAGTLGAGVFGGTTSQGGPPPPDNMILSIPFAGIPFP